MGVGDEPDRELAGRWHFATEPHVERDPGAAHWRPIHWIYIGQCAAPRSPAQLIPATDLTERDLDDCVRPGRVPLTRCRLINPADAAVADVPLHPLLANVAVAAEHLHGEVGDLETQPEERLHR